MKSANEGPSPSHEEMCRALEVLFPADAVIEIRALSQKGRKRTDAGYFDCKHRKTAIATATATATKLNSRGAAVYVTLNLLDPQLLARYANRLEEYATATATDSNVMLRLWLLIDIDPQRPKDTSATDAQFERAKERAVRVSEYLEELIWNDQSRPEKCDLFIFLLL